MRDFLLYWFGGFSFFLGFVIFAVVSTSTLTSITSLGCMIFGLSLMLGFYPWSDS